MVVLEGVRDMVFGWTGSGHAVVGVLGPQYPARVNAKAPACC